MVTFQGKEYQLFFSNNLEPLRALNYADELFFREFERLCGSRYRILSIIRKGWQEKYGFQSDITALRKHFERKLTEAGWIEGILAEYEDKKGVLSRTLDTEAPKAYGESEGAALSELLKKIREQAAPLDAMSNMLHLFSSLVGDGFMARLTNYSQDPELINRNFIFYTQPIRESRYAKLVMPELTEKFALSVEDATLSSILRIGAYIKDDVSALLDDRGTKLENLFAEIARRISLDPIDLYYLTLGEIETALKEGRVKPGLIEDRKMLTILFYPEKNLEIREGADAEAFLSKGNFAPIMSDSVGASELEGQTASLGIVSGRAVVVKNSDEALKLVQKGDILVAPYTAPEYLPAMKNAVAIVTETGGITSHAAIVSRELKIPCVIGVADATSILHTGDTIEVNADKGVIRITKRA